MHDISVWKLNKLVKNKDQQEKCKKVIRKEYSNLKAIHIYYASISNFPYMSIAINNDKFVKDFNFLDKNLT